MNDTPEQTIPMDRTGDNGRKPLKARVRASPIIDQIDREINAEWTRTCGTPAFSEEEHLSFVDYGRVDIGKTATTGRLLFEMGDTA